LPKIVVSLCSILPFYLNALELAAGKLNFRKVTKKELTDALLLKSTDYLNFSHFSHF